MLFQTLKVPDYISNVKFVVGSSLIIDVRVVASRYRPTSAATDQPKPMSDAMDTSKKRIRNKQQDNKSDAAQRDNANEINLTHLLTTVKLRTKNV